MDVSYNRMKSNFMSKHTTTETQPLVKVSSSIMCILMFIGFTHHLFTAEEEVQMMAKELPFVDSNQKMQWPEKHTNIYLLHIFCLFCQLKLYHRWLSFVRLTWEIQNENQHSNKNIQKQLDEKYLKSKNEQN